MPPSRSPRIALIDVVRGLAIVGMVIYHCAWDLGFLGFIGVDVTTDFGWLLFARLLLGTFLVLVGVSLYLAHGQTIRWHAFWRRWAMVAGGAVAITVATLVLFPETFVFFGVLHIIALSSLLGLLFLRTPTWLNGLVALVVILAPLVWHHPAFSERALAWIGFWNVPPASNDLVPLFPWFAAVLVGLTLARLLHGTQAEARIAAWKFPGPIGRRLALMGRWSLVIYLVHQPLLLGILMPLATLTGVGEQRRASDFVAACTSQCAGTGSANGYCTNYCRCALETVEANDLWAAIQSPEPTPEQADAVGVVINQCQAPADLSLPEPSLGTEPPLLNTTPPSR